MKLDPDRMPRLLVVLVALLAAAVIGARVTAYGSPSPPTSSLPATDRPYAHTGPGDVSGPAAQARRLVYVPNQVAGTLQVIDLALVAVGRQLWLGLRPQGQRRAGSRADDFADPGAIDERHGHAGEAAVSGAEHGVGA